MKRVTFLCVSTCLLTSFTWAAMHITNHFDKNKDFQIQNTFYAYADEELSEKQTSLQTDASLHLTKGCKAAYLIDSVSGTCLYGENETTRLPIASICKVMTLLLTFDAVERGDLTYESQITISDHAAGMGGSQVFLKAGNSYSLSDLIKSIIVCSANDSCVAVAEAVGGSEENFLARMNAKAEELGCHNTLFANCTGLPKEPQYSCAQDVATMFRALITHEKYFTYSKIWLEDFNHADNRTTTMTNTNKLIKKYAACDGGKTGFTNEAGFCLTATAKKNDMRLISVVLGGSSSDNRFTSTVSLFDYGFANFRNKIVLDKNVPLNDSFVVKAGKQNSLLVYPERNIEIFSRNTETPNVTFEVADFQVKAPVAKGDVVGKIDVYKDNILYDTVNVIAGEDIQKASLGDAILKTANDWPL